MRGTQSVYSYNKGIVDRRAVARLDVKRLQLASEEQTNWMPHALGYMSLRPGLGYLGATRSNLHARFLKLIFATDDAALIELTDQRMRVWIDDEILTRPTVSTTITNGEFDSDLTGWTDMDEGSAVSAWASGRMLLTGDGTSRAIREQHVVTVNTGVEHGIRIQIQNGPVMIRIGSSSGDDDYVAETALETGMHSLSITPAGDFYIRFFSSLFRVVRVASCVIEDAGAVVLTTPWDSTDELTYDTSGDVLFVASRIQQRRIERRGERPGARSWSVALYRSPDGPFEAENTEPMTLTPDGLTGNISIDSSHPLFKQDHEGALFSLTSSGQIRTVNASAEDTFTEAVRVTGFNTARIIAITVSGTFSATVNLQRSFDNATWADVGSPFIFTAPGNNSYNDGLDNQIVFYRIGVKAGDFVSGTAVCTISVESGSIRGIVRVTDYNSATSIDAEVLSDLGGTDGTSIWQEGKWSDLRGWPMAVAIHEGRMWWAGLNGIWGSVSDAFDSFDEEFLGDAGPINRTIGAGPVDTVSWLMSLRGLLVGAQGAEFVARASSLDEPLTPTNFNVKSPSTHGSGAVQSIKIDQACYFVDRTGCRIHELSARDFDYSSSNLLELCPELGFPGFVRMDVQRKPDTRLHVVRSDGKVVVILLNKNEEIVCPILVETDGFIEDVIVLPAPVGVLDDSVYYVVKRTIDGSSVRYLEKWAQEVSCRGGETNLQADAHLFFTGPSETFSVPHLANEDVVVWGNSADLGTNEDYESIYTADGSGLVTLPVIATNVCIGLGYQARQKSTKLSATLNSRGKIDHLGLILADTHRYGLRIGADFTTLRDLPQIKDGEPVTDEVHEEFDQDPIPFPGKWSTDTRICLVAQAPRPATVVGAVAPNMIEN